MQALTNRMKQVDRRKMNFLERLYLVSIFKGMMITFMHMFKKKPTINYPEKTRPFSPVFGSYTSSTGMRKEGRTAPPVVCVQLPVPAEAIMEAARKKRRGRKFIQGRKIL